MNRTPRRAPSRTQTRALARPAPDLRWLALAAAALAGAYGAVAGASPAATATLSVAR